MTVNEQNNAIDQDDDWDFEQFEVESEQLYKECEAAEKYLDLLMSKADFLEDLYDVLKGSNKKLSLLNGLSHINIREQFLSDLFLSESISIFEGFVHNTILLMEKHDKVLNVSERAKYLSNIDGWKNISPTNLFERLKKRTLNDPFVVSQIFKSLLDIPIDQFGILKDDSFEEFKNRALSIRNAHIHRNSLHDQPEISLEESQQFLRDLIKFVDFITDEICKTIKLEEEKPD